MRTEPGFFIAFIGGLIGAVLGGIIATVVTYIPDWLTNERPEVEWRVSPVKGPAPLIVAGDARPSDPDGDAPLKLFWSVNGAPDGEGERTNHMFRLVNPGFYTLSVRVSDRHGSFSDERVQRVEVTSVAESTQDEQNDVQDNRVLFPERVANNLVEGIKAGEYEQVNVSEFIGTVIATGQIERDVLTDSINDALALLSPDRRKNYERADRWDITITGGDLFVFRTRDSADFSNALEGVTDVLEAIRQGNDVEGVKILIRGTEKFYDIDGIRGLGSRAWIGLDLR